VGKNLVKKVKSKVGKGQKTDLKNCKTQKTTSWRKKGGVGTEKAINDEDGQGLKVSENLRKDCATRKPPNVIPRVGGGVPMGREKDLKKND